MLGGYFFTWMNGIRQMIAACTYLFAVRFISKKRLFPFLLCAAFAYLWHHSSLIMLPFFLLGYSHFVWDKTWLNITIFVLCVIIGNTPTWVNGLEQISPMLAFLGYDYYVDMMDKVLDTSNAKVFDIGPRFLMTFLSYLLVIIFYPKARKSFNSPLLDIFFKLFFIGACIYYLFINLGVLFLRPVLYFTIYALPVTAYVLCYLKNKNNLFFLLLILTTMTFTYISCYSDYRAPMVDRKSYLYQFYFSNV